MLTIISLLLGLLGSASATQNYINPALTLPPTPRLPHPRESGYVNLSTVDIWYAQFGQSLKTTLRQGASPVLFLHGGFGNSDYFGNQISALIQSNENSTLIAIDSREQGRSTGLNQPISYHLMREDVVGVLDHFGIPKARVVGWSDGGIIGLELAIYAPSRLDRLFAFAASYSYENLNATIDNSSVWNAYLARTKQEYAQLSPTPAGYATLYNKLNTVFSVLPNYTQSTFVPIPNLYENCTGAPLIWIVDSADEEVINNGVARTMHNWIPGSGLVILPSASHFA